MKLRIVKGKLFYWVQLQELNGDGWYDYPILRTPHFLTLKGAMRQLRRDKKELNTPPYQPTVVYEEEI